MARELLLYNFTDYRDYLSKYLEDRRKNERGVQTKLSEALNCQPAYVSKVLSMGAHFSLEQSEAASEFCNHTQNEKHFFLLLVQYTRAGTNSLRKYFSQQMEEIKTKQKSLKEHMALDKVSDLETQLEYYGHWKTAAIHVLLTIPQFRNRNAIAAKLHLPVADVNGAIDFLKSKGMVQEIRGELRVGTVGLHLGADSPVIRQHHSNWRIKAMDSINRAKSQDLHYSSVVSMSQADFEQIRAELVKWISRFRQEVESSKEETLVAIGIDYFNV
jgi:uncharacterized protein (TIGR02147 family)